jgi:hypothetical protein
MNRTRVAALLLPIALVAAPAATSAGGAAPVLALVQRTPLKIRGLHFKPRESVRVTATTAAGRASVVVRTSRGGRLRAAFGDFSPTPCLRLVVKAVGARGDRARLIVDPKPGSMGIPCGV